MSKDTIRRRIKRGQLQAEKDNFASQWWVLLPQGAQGVQHRPQAPRQDTDVVAELRAHVGSLRQQVTDLQVERDRLLALLEAAVTERPTERRRWPGAVTMWRRFWTGEE